MYMAYTLSEKCNDCEQFILNKGIEFIENEYEFCDHITCGTSIIIEIICFFVENNQDSHSFFER